MTAPLLSCTHAFQRHDAPTSSAMILKDLPLAATESMSNSGNPCFTVSCDDKHDIHLVLTAKGWSGPIYRKTKSSANFPIYSKKKLREIGVVFAKAQGPKKDMPDAPDGFVAVTVHIPIKKKAALETCVTGFGGFVK